MGGNLYWVLVKYCRFVYIYTCIQKQDMCHVVLLYTQKFMMILATVFRSGLYNVPVCTVPGGH